MAEFFNEYGALLWEGTLETLYMTLFATLFAYVLGLPMGVLLTVTKAGGVAPAPRFNAVFGWLVNLLRSLPFIILMFFIIPFTRLLVGTSIGATAALVPLTLSAAPFIARMVEQSLEEIDTGVIEAAQCMGATRWQIVTRVLLVESVPSLLRGLSISLITILGYTAITGSVGAGGLGNLAFRFGYQRYQKPVMYATVLLLILLVCVIQIIFDLILSLFQEISCRIKQQIGQKRKHDKYCKCQQNGVVNQLRIQIKQSFQRFAPFLQLADQRVCEQQDKCDSKTIKTCCLGNCLT